MFMGAGLQMQVRLEREWLDARMELSTWGSESTLSFNEVDKTAGPDRLDLKVGSSDVVENIYRGGKGGSESPSRGRTAGAIFPRYQTGPIGRLDRGSEAWQAVEENA